MHDLHQFHLVELVVADHAARVLAVCASLAPEAGRVTDEFQRQGFELDDLVAHDIGQRYLGGRNEVELALLAPRHGEQVVFEFRQLSRAVHAFGFYDVWRIDLGVAVLHGMHVEHQLSDRAMQSGKRSPYQRKPGPRDLSRRLEVELRQPRADVDVIPRSEVEPAWRARAPEFDVIFGRFSERDRLMRQVRHGDQEFLLPLLNGLETFFQIRELGIGALRLGPQGRGILALGLRLTDALGELVARSLQLLRADLHALALPLDRLERRDIEYERPRRESLCHGVDVVAEELRIKHAYFFFFALLSSPRRYASFSAILASSPRSVGSYHLTSGISSGK